ncbi:MAG: hypothetical protein ACRCZ9_05745 [Fusobacteriaceae bacterium]
MAEIRMKDITSKLAEKNKEITDMKTHYEFELQRIKKENLKLMKSQIRTSNAEKYKLALRLYANGFGVGLIHRTMVYEEGEEITLDEIRSLIDRIDMLDDELRKYFYVCKKEFTDNVNINKGFFASTIYKKYQLLENVVSEQLIKSQEIGDDELTLKCVNELKNIYKEMSAVFFKNGFETESDGTMEELESDYNDNKAATIISFKDMKIV